MDNVVLVGSSRAPMQHIGGLGHLFANNEMQMQPCSLAALMCLRTSNLQCRAIHTGNCGTTPVAPLISLVAHPVTIMEEPYGHCVGPMERVVDALCKLALLHRTIHDGPPRHELYVHMVLSM